MNKPTRFYSKRQEKQVAKTVGGNVVPNSGATPFRKGDVITDLFLLECKTCTTAKASFTIQREWLSKNKEEAFAMRRNYNALCFDFGPDTNRYYIIDEKLFKQLLEYLEVEECKH